MKWVCTNWPPIFQSTNQPVLTGIDQLKPVLTTGPANSHIDRSFANLAEGLSPRIRICLKICGLILL